MLQNIRKPLPLPSQEEKPSHPECVAGCALEAFRVYLRPPCEKDFPFLFAWRSDTRDLFLWSGARDLLPQPAFAEELQQDCRRGVQRLMVLAQKTDTPIGQVFSYSYDPANGYVFAGIYLCPEMRRLALGVEAAFLYLRYLFAYLAIHKVYCDVYEFNRPMRRLLERLEMHREGAFPQHLYYNGRHWAMFRYAIYREDIQRLAPQLLPLLERRGTQVPASALHHPHAHPVAASEREPTF
jgi:RimJ/RimL family protein N-acetyltransferase